MKTCFESKSTGWPRVRTGLFLLLALLAGWAGNGCLSRPALRYQTFAFQSPPPKPGPPTGMVIALSPATVPGLFDKPSFFYRTGPEAYELDAYAGFLAPPSLAITVALRDRLLASGRFQDVIESGSRVKADEFMEVRVSEIYGDFSRTGQRAAVLSMRVTVLDAKSGAVVLRKDYSRRIPLPENSAAAVMAGWDQALDEITDAVIADLAPPRG